MDTLYGYVFDTHGRHDGKWPLTTTDALHTFIVREGGAALCEGRECMITDTADNACFHVQAGRVVYASSVDPARYQAMIEALYARMREA